MTTKPATLARLLTAQRLLRLAGDAAFARGEAYRADGRVRSLRCDGNVLAAQVMGTRPYRVQLWPEGRDLGFSCTCPVVERGEFCKHCVAVGLAWLAQSTPVGEPASTGDIRTYLSGLTVGKLVDIVMARADEDDVFYQRLLLRAAQYGKAQGDVDLGVWRQAFDDAVESTHYVEYDEAGGYAGGIEDVVDSIEDLLKEGDYHAVIELAEYGLEALEDVIENVDDSDGEMGQLLQRLQDLHLAACRQSPPDPVALARRLFEWELLGEWDVFRDTASIYADILGKPGLVVYRQLAEAEWKKVPALAPGSKADRYGKRFNITRIMETLARQSGDLEALVEIMRRDLSLPYAFLEIATLYKEAGRTDEALVWAEQGWRAFKKDQADDRLREFLATAYQERGRHQEAMMLMWERFSGRPTLETYRALHDHAKCAGKWPQWREKALAHIHERLAAVALGRKPSRSVHSQWAPAWSDRSLLVEIFLWERRFEDAWREAKAGGCSQGFWLQLAEKREKVHPQDALAVYRAHIPKLLDQTDNRAYQDAMRYLRKVKALFTDAGEAEQFRPYLTDLRASYARKRNFIKLLDQERW